ncbi:GatB/YqeY domain-containing protein [Poronia punctata]|nr:GatB/YqeY domain-containing protein [Poronia punctata]
MSFFHQPAIMMRKAATATTTTNLLRPRAIPRIPAALFRPYSDSSSSSSSSSSTPPPAPPPLLQKLKNDLKTAMRAKDTARLSVLRTILSATLNASKTSSPITTDAALVSLIRKQARSATDARGEFAAAGRQDLVEKEDAQIRVLEGYVQGSGVEELSGEGLIKIVRDVVGKEKEKEGGGGKTIGGIMKVLLKSPGGPLEGKNVEKGELVRVVKDVLGG